MNNEVAKYLKELIRKYGTSLCNDPKRCRALLLDYCGGYKKEVNVLLMALNYGAPSVLLSSHDFPIKIVYKRLSKEMSNELGMTVGVSYWSIETWGYALGLDSEETDLYSKKQQKGEQYEIETEPVCDEPNDVKLFNHEELHYIYRLTNDDFIKLWDNVPKDLQDKIVGDENSEAFNQFVRKYYGLNNEDYKNYLRAQTAVLFGLLPPKSF